MKIRITDKRNCFTLIEMIVALGVFSLLAVIMLSFLSSAQRIWSTSANRSSVFENARLALGLIARDIQCSYYDQGSTPFYHYVPASASLDNNDRETLYFVSSTSCPPSYACNSKLCEIAYTFYAQDDTANACKLGWLVRSVTGDGQGTNSKWNFAGKAAEDKVYSNSNPGDSSFAFTKGSSSKDSYEYVIPYVTSLSFTCYNKKGEDIQTLTPPGENLNKMFPYSVRVDLTLMDRESWLKWRALDSATPTDLADTGNAEAFRKNNERRFTRTILIGERGQRY